MADESLEKIKNGQGISPQPNPSSGNTTSGITHENRGNTGVTHDKFTKNSDQKKDNNNG